ncbi:MAG: DNA polymerase III subunit beta [Candidatus Diapherotrites archaeon]|nr:DNA polymerase III subunit beta [Candidatus Diapherotrites archaeon]
MLVNAKIVETALRPIVKFVFSQSSKILEVLNHIRFSVGNGLMEIAASNGENTLIVSSPLKTDENMSFFILGDRFYKILKAIGDKDVQISYDTQLVTISADDTIFHLQTIQPSEYPTKLLEIPNPNTETSFVVRAEDFVKGVSKISSFVSDSASLPSMVFSGLLFDVDGDNLNLVASDTIRMGIYSAKCSWLGEPQSVKFVLPASPLEVLAEIFDTGEIQASMIKEGDDIVAIVFRKDNMVSKITVINGTYPNYKGVIPSDLKNKAIIDKNALKNIINKISILVSKENNRIDFEFTKDKLTALVDNKLIGQGVSTVSMEYNGEDFVMGLNYLYLLDGINSIDASVIHWENNGSESVSMLSSPEEKDYLYLFMPMRRS